MTSKELCEVINTNLFVPISEYLTSQLLEVAKSLIPDMTENDVYNCSMCFFKKQISISYIRKFKTKYKNTYGKDLMLPNVVFIILETCQLLLLLQSDEVDDDLKVKTSLIVRNNAIWQKGEWRGLLCPEWVEEMYSYYPENGNKTFMGYYNFDTLLKSIVPHGTWIATGLNVNDSKIYNSLRCLCASVVRGRVSSFALSPAFKNLRSPFSQVYLLVKQMLKEWQWKYIDVSPVKRIFITMGDNTRKRKMLAKIVEDVRNELPTSSILEPKENSSVLLDRIAKGKNKDLDGRQFSVLEFGVYLYYEFLLETFND